MKAIRKNVDSPAKVIDVDLNYDFMSATVGGYIQMVPIGPNVDVVCNEEGMYAGPNGTPLPFNAGGYLGNILIVATDEDGENRDLTAEEQRKGLAYLAKFANLKHDLSGQIEIITGKEAVEKAIFNNVNTLDNFWNSL